LIRPLRRRFPGVVTIGMTTALSGCAGSFNLGIILDPPQVTAIAPPTASPSAIASPAASATPTGPGATPAPWANRVLIAAVATPAIYVPGPDSGLQDNPTSVQLSATVEFSDGTTKEDVSWASDTPEIAHVDGSGLVHAVAAGEAIVVGRSRDGLASGSIAVRVLTGGRLGVAVQ